MSKQLTKSRTNKKLSGVIGGLGEYFGWSEDLITLVRIVYAVLAVTSFGSLVLIYIIAAMVLPRAPRQNDWRNDQDFSSHYRWPGEGSSSRGKNDRGFSQWPGDAHTPNRKRKDVTPFDDVDDSDEDDGWSQF